jgi:lipid-A-disaccharide synthase-like uncharacterized protein
MTISSGTIWVIIGFAGQGLFTARFLVQWLASERKRDSVVPVQFWWLSLLGGLVLLAYVTHRRDPVLIVGQSMGVFIYIRNLMLVSKGKRRADRHRQRAETAGEVSPGRNPHRVDAPQLKVMNDQDLMHGETHRRRRETRGG